MAREYSFLVLAPDNPSDLHLPVQKVSLDLFKPFAYLLFTNRTYALSRTAGAAVAWAIILLYDTIIFVWTIIGVRRLRARDRRMGGVSRSSSLNLSLRPKTIVELVMRDGEFFRWVVCV